MTLGRKITLALTFTLALLAGFVFLRLGDHQGSARQDRQPRSPVPHQDHAPNSRNLTQQQPLRTDSHTPEPARIHIKARLLEGSLVEATLRVGSISAEDWIEINAEGSRRKPSDLLNFGDPRPIAVTPDGQGNGLLDLQALAPAAAYRIEALRPADGAWYAHDFIPEQGKVPTADRLDDLGDIPPTLPTGIELHFINAPPGVEDFEVTLQRQPSQDTVKDASEALRLVERLRPDILDALREEGALLAHASDPLRLAPLPPDPTVRVRFRTLTGVEGNFSDFPLRPQQVLPVTVNLAAIFRDVPSGVASLRGRLLLGDTGRPLGGATIEREAAPLTRRQVTDADGSFAFDALPPGAPCRFHVQVPRGSSPRPLCREEHWIDYTPPADPPPGGDRVEWRIPPYRWIILKLTTADQAEIKRLTAQSPIRQPLYLLQRSVDGAWTDISADEFLISPGEVAVSAIEDGAYRIVAAPSLSIRSPASPSR